MLAPVERSRDAKAEVGGQRPADAGAGDLRSGGQSGQESELGGPRPAGSRPELKDK